MNLQEFFDCFKSNGYSVGERYIDLGSNAFVEHGFGFITIHTMTKPYTYEMLAARIYIKNIREVIFSDKSMKLLVENDIGTVQIEVKL